MKRFTTKNVPEIGYKHGYLKVVSSPFYKKSGKDNYNHYFVSCECICGSIFDAFMNSLHETKSCGCMRYAKPRNKRFGSSLDKNGNKICSCCRINKKEKDFVKTKSNSDGLSLVCRDCNKYKKIATSYGLSRKEYTNLLEQVNYSCECCGIKFDNSVGKTKCHVDHDHQTGKIRGLLCNNCNLGIGSLGDNITSLENALKYLKKHYDNN